MLVMFQALDSDSTDDKIVLNRIVPLKEDSSKNS
jgi:glutaminyl-tRNA synthetase